MSVRLANNPDLDSNDETESQTTMSFSEDETYDEEISQLLTPETNFQKEFGRTTDKKKTRTLQLDCFSWRRTQIIRLPANQKSYDTFEATV